MELLEARRRAEEIVALMEPYCEVISIAGSIRRGKPEVKDIEIVLVPKMVVTIGPEEAREPLLPIAPRKKQPTATSLWHEWAKTQTAFDWIKPHKPKLDTQIHRGYPVTGSERYLQAILGPGDDALKMDVFITTRPQWGNILLLRTGSGFFNQALFAYAKRIKRRFVKGWVRNEKGEPMPMMEERDVFDYIGLNYIEPRCREVPDLEAAYKLIEHTKKNHEWVMTEGDTTTYWECKEWRNKQIVIPSESAPDKLKYEIQIDGVELRCSCMSYRFSASPKSCKHIRKHEKKICVWSSIVHEGVEALDPLKPKCPACGGEVCTM